MQAARKLKSGKGVNPVNDEREDQNPNTGGKHAK
jgi:hypothetical protein